MTPSFRHSVVFMGTPDFAVPSLKVLAEHHDVRSVYSQPPRPSGRGMKPKPSAVHQAANELGLDVEVSHSFDDEDSIARLASYQPDILVVVAYGLVLPQAVLDIPRLMAINGHASMLPRWRGAAPIQHALAAGDAITGVSIIKMEPQLDAGAILLTKTIPIAPTDTSGDLHDKLGVLTADALKESLMQIDQLEPIAQDSNQVTWADKIVPQMAEIDFTLKAAEIERKVRAFTPSPGAWIAIGQDGARPLRLKVNAVKIREVQGEAGSVLGQGAEGGPLIATADAAVELTKIQPQGKGVMSGRDFLNGHSLPSAIRPLSKILG